ncbi:MAG: helix-turn-helix transcriptional regulator [Gammaproteobacteria bacterium]
MNGYKPPYKFHLMKSTLQERLVEARVSSGLTQQTICKLVGITQPTLSDLEKGKSKSSAKLPELAFILGVDAYWLATGKGRRTPKEEFDPLEREFISLIRQLDDSGKRRLLAQIQVIVDFDGKADPAHSKPLQ